MFRICIVVRPYGVKPPNPQARYARGRIEMHLQNNFERSELGEFEGLAPHKVYKSNQLLGEKTPQCSEEFLLPSMTTRVILLTWSRRRGRAGSGSRVIKMLLGF
jgi:hypothetical protein